MRLQKIDVSFQLPLRNLEELTNTLADIYNPASPNFHHYLSQPEFTERFGPTESDYAAVVAFAQIHHLTVTHTLANRLSVTVHGAVFDMESALHVHINDYKDPITGSTFRAPDQDPTLDLAVPLRAVEGLDNYYKAKPRVHFTQMTNVAFGSVSGGNNNNGGKAIANALTGSASGGYYAGYDFRKAYCPGVTNLGTGQSIGLLELQTGWYPVDIVNYESTFGLPNVTVTPVLIDGYSGAPGSENPVIECTLDIEMAIDMCPGASSVRVYEANSIYVDAVNTMASENLCKTLSSSWAWSGGSSPDAAFLEMAAQGQSFFEASGDSGSSAYPNVGTSYYYPDGDPNVTMVGGTSLTTSGTATESWVSEAAWSLSGGGWDTNFTLPTWQQGVITGANYGSTTYRNFPDVAMTATNIYIIADNGLSGSVSGTSAATPLWAGFVALANQLAASKGVSPVGFLNPTIYKMGKGSNAVPYSGLFHDIVGGNNGTATDFPAITGYDLVTGWGSPTGSNLVQQLGFPEPLAISPAVPVVFSGLSGGPFSPSSTTYTLSDTGTAPLNWLVSAPPAWLDVSPASGTLTNGGSTTPVTVSIDPSATNFAAGSYATSLSFTNLTDGVVQTFAVTLAVVTPPVITSQPTNLTLLAGQTATFNVGIATNALAYYQWRTNGINLTDGGNISGSATPTLTISGVASNNIASYSVVVSNVTGVAVSSNAALSIIASKPVFVLQPTNQSVLPGGPTTLIVSVVGSTPYHYQWQFNGTNLATSSTKYTSGVTSSNLVIANFVTTNVGNYTVVVTNSLGSVTSSVAALSLTPVTTTSFALNAPGSFSATTTQPENPYAGLVYVPSQTAYFGTTENGGGDGGGSTFKVTTAGTISREHSFTGGTDGAFPVAPLILGQDGILYGVSYEYGTYSDGSLWKELPNATAITALVQFNGDNGIEPVSGVTQGADNRLYGACNAGGAFGYGTIFVCATNATAVTNLISFNGTDGAFPSPILAQGTDGYLYGTAENGGIYGSDAGTVYKISTNGVFTVLHNFNGTNDGAVPIAGVTLANDGNYYGTTLEGGAYNEGTVYEITPSGVFTTLYSFTGGADGAEPWGGLIQATNGNLYGTTQQGGTYGDGTVFQVSLAGTYTTIAEFDGYQGANSEGNLVQGPDGNLYGVTLNGGQSGYGAFFSLTNIGALQITGNPVSQSVYAGATVLFTVGTSGSAARSYQWQENGTNLLNGSGVFGATSSVLILSNVVAASAASYSVVATNAYNSVTSSPAVLTVIQAGPAIVTQPASVITVAGLSVSFTVGATGNLPLIYQWQENGTNLTDGGSISGSATATLTLSGVVAANSGTYSVTVSNTLGGVVSSNAYLSVVSANVSSVVFTNLHLFAGGAADGRSPQSSLIQALDGNLYGTASDGGANFVGTIFRQTLAGVFTNFYNFVGGTNSAYPNGGLVQAANGNLFGMTQQGGVNADGSIYKMTNYTTLSLIYSFGGATDGQSPDDSLIIGSDGNFYGTAFEGGASSDGSVFQVLPSGTVNVLHSFTGGGDGASPYAGLTQGSDGSYYGTTTAGGTNGFGTAFKVATNGVFTTLVTFNGTNGSKPFGGLVQAKDGNFYGTTAQGGASGYGTVFKLTTNGVLTTLYSFAGTDGGFPGASLIQAADGYLYGTTEGNGTISGGGLGGYGTVFRVSTNGTLTTLLWFDGLNGAQPEAALLQASDGNLYGTTALGGTGFFPSSGGGNGGIFRIILPVLLQNGLNATSAIAGLPYSGSLVGEATAPAGDSVTYALVSGPSWLNVATNGLLSGTPTGSNLGTNTFVIGVTDASGFSASTNLQIVVNLPPPPVITVPATIVDQATNLSGNAEFYTVTATDLVDGAISPVVSPVSGSTFTLGTNVVTATVTDSLGLSATNTFLVIIVDTNLPVIVSQPVSLTNNAGTTASFSVTATAFSPLSYQWSFGANALAGQTNSTLTIASVDPTNAGAYTVAVTSSGGTTNSTVATLTVIVPVVPTPPVIMVPPTIIDQATNIAGNVEIFSVTATDAVDGVILPTVTPASGSTFPLGTNIVTATATDSYGLSATNTFLVIIVDTNLPVIVSQPVSLTNNAGTSASFSVTATAFSPLSYQWSFGTNVLAGATNSTFGIASVDPTNAGAYMVAVTSSGGTTNSTFATLTVIVPTPPVIVVPPTIIDQATNIAGNVEIFSVTATDAVDGVILPTVTPASGSTFPLGTNIVTATATDSYGLSATNTFLVIIVDTNLPVIVSQPVSLTNNAGTSASFSVTATAFSPLSYQWSFGTNVLTDETNSTYTIASVGPTNVGSYTVAVTSQGGTTNSTLATLTVVYTAPTVVGGQSSLGAGGFQFSFSGPSGQTYEVLASNDLTQPQSAWAVVGTGTFGGTNAVFIDTNAVNNPYQFYSIKSP
jgi:uncharacterized repeat protein (TIGR03803 family)